MERWDDIIEVPLPLPFALRIINAYLIKGDHGYTIIDCGLHTEASLQRWEQARKEIGFAWEDVEKIVITHYHPDHYGMAGRLQEMTQAPVYLSETDWKQAQMFFARDSHMPEFMASYYSKHGLPKEWIRQIPEHLKGFRKWVEPHPQVKFLQAGEMIRLGNHRYQIYHTPGHADGHLSFYQPERRIMIAGDFLLPKISPNISLWPKCYPNPLALFFETLERMKKVPVNMVYPAHGPVFTHYVERIEELIAHHHQRLEAITRFVAEKGEVTAAEVCFHLFGTDLSIHNLRFAMAESMAHLQYLYRQKKINTIEKNDTYLWTK